MLKGKRVSHKFPIWNAFRVSHRGNGYALRSQRLSTGDLPLTALKHDDAFNVPSLFMMVLFLVSCRNIFFEIGDDMVNEMFLFYFCFVMKSLSLSSWSF